MSISSTFDRLHAQAKANAWLRLFSIFCRFMLALGFIPAGIVKIMDERFASGLSANHPMGHYLEALHLTGYYYTFIGIAQIVASIFLLIPRTVTLGAFIYFPIILNICILTYATRFNGSLFTAPLMTLANLYLLGWNYEKWKYILPFNHLPDASWENADHRGIFVRDGVGALYTRFRQSLKQLFNQRFPVLFFAGVFAAVIICVIGIPNLYSIKPHNEIAPCLRQFNGTRRTQAGASFCSCIHKNGEPLNTCLTEYFSASDDSDSAP